MQKAWLCQEHLELSCLGVLQGGDKVIVVCWSFSFYASMPQKSTKSRKNIWLKFVFMSRDGHVRSMETRQRSTHKKTILLWKDGRKKTRTPPYTTIALIASVQWKIHNEYIVSIYDEKFSTTDVVQSSCQLFHNLFVSSRVVYSCLIPALFLHFLQVHPSIDWIWGEKFLEAR